MSLDCKEKLNPSRVNRDGVNQGKRLLASLDPSYVKVDEHEPAHWIDFTTRFAGYIRYFGDNNLSPEYWTKFFKGNAVAPLATAAIQQIETYKAKVRECFQYLQDLENKTHEDELRKNFGNLFNGAGTLAWQLEILYQSLPDTINLKAVMMNMIQAKLTAGLQI
jgi:hypothetical protein